MSKNHPRGLTLLEFLVAISLLALMGALTWRGLDAMLLTQSRLGLRAEEVHTLRASLTQWETDLDALASQPGQRSLSWDGSSLRMVRHTNEESIDGLQVVAWYLSRRHSGGEWVRWQSEPVHTRTALSLAWEAAAQLGKSDNGTKNPRELTLLPLDRWQLYYYRGNSWSNPLSSSSIEDREDGSDYSVPEGIRLMLTLASGQSITGVITRDWLRRSEAPLP
jgi:general secretion pathway protein J